MGFDEATIERFWSKVDKRSPDECWEWKACVSPKGYGLFGFYKTRNVRAHRYALMLETGIYQTPLHCLHSCDNPKCCNPKHLRWGTNDDNMEDRKRSKRWKEWIKSDRLRKSAENMRAKRGY